MSTRPTREQPPFSHGAPSTVREPLRREARLGPAVWALLLLALPLGTAPGEIAAGLVTALAVVQILRRRASLDPELAWPVALIAVSWLASGIGRDPAAPQLIEALGRCWPLSLVLLLPALPISAPDSDRAQRIGLWAAAGVGALAVLQVALSGAPPWETPAKGLFSHHLTLGYGLLPALAVAVVARSWVPAALIALGVAATGSSGPALSVAVIALGLLVGPGRALVGGALAAIALVVGLRADPALTERAVLWTSGATLALQNPLGVGPAGFREAAAPVQASLVPDFYFPLHAHDAALQIAALAGWGAWVAWAWLALALWRRADRAGRLAIAALAVGGLTQDTFGDLEVIRALSAWVLLRSAAAGTEAAE